MNNLQIIKKSIKHNTLDELPEEAFTGLDQLFIIEGKRQARTLSNKPTLKSITSRLVEAESTDRTRLLDMAKQIEGSRDIDEAEYEIGLTECISKADFNLAKQFIVLYEANDIKGMEQVKRRQEELRSQAYDQMDKPLCIENYDQIERIETETLKVQIDWLLDNGVEFKKKVFYAFIAMTNGGKTIIKTWLSVMFIKSGYNVLFLAQEEPKQDTYRRVWQAVLGLTEEQYNDRVKENYEDVGKAYNHISNSKIYGKFYCVEWPNIRIGNLKSKIKRCQQSESVKFDAIFIDYGKLLDVDSSRKNVQEWERIGIIFKEIKQMCMDLNVCAVTSIQLNREASAKLLKDGTTPDLTSVSGAYEATHHANYIWSVKLNYAQELPATKTKDTILGTFELHVQKQKYGNLRPGDNMRFTWTADHMLTQSQESNEAPAPTIPWSGNYQLQEGELSNDLNDILNG